MIQQHLPSRKNGSRDSGLSTIGLAILCANRVVTWQDYQEEAADFFRNLGLEVETDITLQGVRTTHDIDVLVKSRHVGFEVTWVVECKQWATPVSKLHVLALREIVADLGADRGILLAENGFQSGAVEAANLTNVHVTSLADVSTSATTEVTSMRLRDYYDRIEACRERYWGISKADRIDHGLRCEFGPGYSGALTIDLVNDLLVKAFRGRYPIEGSISMGGSSMPIESATFLNIDSVTFHNIQQLIDGVESLVADLEGRLESAERALGTPNKTPK